MAYGAVSRGIKLNGGNSTIIVAASNSRLKTRADYVCDGTADEVQINQAINALPSTGGEVHLLDGTFNTGSSIIMRNSVTLSGLGDSTVIVPVSGIRGSVYGNLLEYLIIRDIKITRTRSVDYLNTDGSSGIFLFNCGHSIIERCHISGNTIGIEILGGDAKIINNVAGSNDWYGILINQNSGSVVSENTAENNGYYGIYFYFTYFCKALGNRTNVSGSHGINMDSGYSNIISNNHVMSSGTMFAGLTGYGILCYRSLNNVISNNLCYNSSGLDGIRVSGVSPLNRSQDNVVVGNRCYTNGRYGISASADTDRTIILGNNCTGNTTGSIADFAANSEVAHNVV